MGEILRFFKDNEVFIYLILGIFAAWYFRKFFLAWGELRIAAFGLERQSAQSRLNWVTTILILIFMLAVTEFVLVAFVAPTVPGASPLITPTIDLLATPTITLEPNLASVNTTPFPTLETQNDGCVPDKVDITSPQPGETIRDIVEIRGSVDIPNFGFYKFEMAAIGDPSWLTIQAGEIITQAGQLGFWDTTRLSPGEYALRLVVTDNQGNSIEPCVIQVRVEPPTEIE
jgi:hypothetical protein